MIQETNKTGFTIFGFLYNFILILQVYLLTNLEIALQVEMGRRQTLGPTARAGSRSPGGRRMTAQAGAAAQQAQQPATGRPSEKQAAAQRTGDGK